MARGYRHGGGVTESNIVTDPLPLIPVMTSNSAPYGTITATGQLSDTYAAWKAMDGNLETYWVITSSTSSGWIQYQLPYTAIIRKIKLVDQNGSPGTFVNGIRSFFVSGSNDGSYWTDLITVNRTSCDQTMFDSENTSAFKYVRLTITATFSGYIALQEFQVYGEYAVGDVPIMTSNDTPKGLAFTEQSLVSGSYPYYAFDANPNTVVAGNSQYHDAAYMFEKPIEILYCNYNVDYYNKVYLQYSDDGTTWTAASEESTLTPALQQTGIIFTSTGIGKHRFWRFRGYQNSAGNGNIRSVQFYSK